ncbi:MAG: enoyl-CoA hydratase-related protein [Planctomycetota bacterium]|jgi:methylglutaconyl-CoA hydratase
MSIADNTAGLEIKRDGPVARVILNRPEVHNAFDAKTILSLEWVFTALGRDREVRVIVLSGAGKSFSAGGDLNWMRDTAGYTIEENTRDAEVLARMFQTVDRVSKPVIAAVHGFCLGGGTGLISCCDLVLAAQSATFGFSEVRLGLLPAVISPFVLRRIGEARARALMLTGERFSAERAVAIGLCDEAHADEALEAAVTVQVQRLLKGGPNAQGHIKTLCREVANKPPEEVLQLTAKVIAIARASAEGSEGVTAFLEKRRPAFRAS